VLTVEVSIAATPSTVLTVEVPVAATPSAVMLTVEVPVAATPSTVLTAEVPIAATPSPLSTVQVPIAPFCLAATLSTVLIRKIHLSCFHWYYLSVMLGWRRIDQKCRLIYSTHLFNVGIFKFPGSAWESENTQGH
jgi:hypothetical protein